MIPPRGREGFGVPDFEDRKKIGTFGAKTAIKRNIGVGRRSEDNQTSDNSRSEDASVVEPTIKLLLN